MSPHFSVDAINFLAMKSRQDLAAWLSMSDRQIRYVLYSVGSNDKYKTFAIKKRNGGQRQIEAPISALKRIQRRIHDVLLEVAPASGIAKGFVPGGSIYEHARRHRKKRWVVTADLTEFFPSINFGRVRGAFMAKPLSLPPAVATCLAQLCCNDGCLPQGAPSSPVISNLICRALDRALLGLAKKHRLSVTRYADDICFSTNEKEIPSAVVISAPDGKYGAGADLCSIVSKAGFQLNPSKLRVLGARDRQMVTGLVVNRNVSAPRAWRRQLRVLLHVLDRHGEEAGLTIVNAWPRSIRRNTAPGSLRRLIVGKANFARWLDCRSTTGFVESLHRGYPRLRGSLPRVAAPRLFRLMTEGDTDALHLASALRNLQASGEFVDLAPKFKNYSGDKGDADLLATLYRIAKADVDELTIGVFDCDNPKIMKQLSVDPGGFARLGRMVYAFFLAPPSPTWQGPFCIESLYSRDQSTRLTSEGRRLFFAGEFDGNGLHVSGEFSRKYPKQLPLVVSDQVIRIADGKSVLLSKMEFAQMVFDQVDPFGNVSFAGFRPTFAALLGVVDAHHS